MIDSISNMRSALLLAVVFSVTVYVLLQLSLHGEWRREKKGVHMSE